MDENRFRGLSAEALLVKLAAHERNAHNTNLIIGCLVKRLGEVLVDGAGAAYRVVITNEEFGALEGGLHVEHSSALAALVLTLHASQAAVIETPEKEAGTT